MTFKRIAVSAIVALLSLFALTVPASPAQAAPCTATCMSATPASVPIQFALAPENCRYNYSVCGYESFNYLCDDGCEIITSHQDFENKVNSVRFI
jgi:hypothetical protein